MIDEPRRRLLLYGGLDSNGIALGDLWSMNLDGTPQWTLLSPFGAAPPARYRAAVVCDRSNDRLIIAAGIGDGGFTRSDAWELPLGGPLQWNALAATGAGPAGGVVGAEDRTQARMLVVARGVTTTYLWELPQDSAPVWRSLAPGGTVPATDDFQFAAAYDPVSMRMPLTWDLKWPYPGTAEGFGPPPRTYILQFAPPPVVHLTARLDSVVYSRSFSALTWHITTDTTLSGPIRFERLQNGVWVTILSAFLNPSGVMTLHETALLPGQRYSYRLEWPSGSSMQQTPVFDIDTPPPPTVLHVSAATFSWYDDNINNGHDLFVEWSVPDDSASWLAPIAIERRKDGGVWARVVNGFAPPNFGPVVTAKESDPEIGHRYEFRLLWGPTLTEHTGGDTSFVIPPRPVFLAVPVAYPGHIEMDWSYPPDPNLVVTGYATYFPATFPPRAIPIARPYPSNVVRLIDLTPLPSGATATYHLGWDVGTGERFTPDYSAYVGDSLGSPPPPPNRLSMSAPWPQPASASLQLALHLNDAGPARLSLFDLNGRLVREQTVAGSGDQVLTVDLKGVRSGVYLIRATQGGVTTSRRAVIVR